MIRGFVLAAFLSATLSIAPAGVMVVPEAQVCGDCCKKNVKNVRDCIRDCSVTVCVSKNEEWMPVGSGTLFRTTDGVVMCLTAMHVVNQSPSPFVLLAQFGIDPTGKDASKKLKVYAEVVAFDCEADLCLLRVGQNVLGVSAKGYAGQQVPGPDTPILTCGSYEGRMHHSIAKGEIIGVGWHKDGQTWDRCDATVFPGSSGGGVFLEDGQWIGLMTHATGQRVGHYIPIREVRVWLRSVGAEVILDGGQLRKHPCQCCPCAPACDCESCKCCGCGNCQCGKKR